MTTTIQKKTTKPRSPKTTSKDDLSKIELPSNPFVFEVFNLVSKQRSNQKKIEVLKKYEHPSIKSLFIWNYDESITSVLPEGDVPYASVGEQNSFSGTISEKINDAVYKMEEMNSNSLGSQDQGKSSIRKEYQKFYNFVKGGNDSLTSLRRETMFINLLQGLHPLEAEILILVKDKKLETKYKITKEIVSEAYSDIKWGGSFVSKLYEVIEKTQNTERNMESWTTAEKETCKTRYNCDILIENGSYSDVCTKDVPNDAYIVKYIVEGKICFDLTRGTRVRLFDMYWDKFRDNLKSIEFGFGRINPKLWGYQKTQKKKRK